MLTLSALHLAFGPEPVVAGLDLRVAPGEFVVVLGPSGCGKTTLLRLAAGAILPTGGTVANGFPRTAMVFQDPRLLPWADATDNAAFGLKAQGVERGARRERAGAILRRLGFGPGDLAKRPSALSGGMRQRVAVARALAVEPGLVLMDEPFAALDVGLRRRSQDLVRAAVDEAGIAVLFVTHDVAEAVRLASRIVVLSPRPARLVADLPNLPETDPARILDAAARLLRRPEIEVALFPPPPAEADALMGGEAGTTCGRCAEPVCRAT